MDSAITTAISTGLSTISTDVTSVLGIVVPVAIGIAGLVFVVRKAMGWFKSLAK